VQGHPPARQGFFKDFMERGLYLLCCVIGLIVVALVVLKFIDRI
jgi:hypothetical protein